jgi:hypothetical protein
MQSGFAITTNLYNRRSEAIVDVLVVTSSTTTNFNKICTKSSSQSRKLKLNYVSVVRHSLRTCAKLNFTGNTGTTGPLAVGIDRANLLAHPAREDYLVDS